MKTTVLRTLAFLLLSSLLAACGTSTSGAVRSGTAKAVTSTTNLPAPDTTSESGAYTGVSDYRIGALGFLDLSELLPEGGFDRNLGRWPANVILTDHCAYRSVRSVAELKRRCAENAAPGLGLIP